MRQLPLLLASFFVLASLAVKSQDTELFQRKLFISPAGDTLRYRILFPENYEKGKIYPLVLFLHGAGERGSDNEKQLVHGASLFLADSNRHKYPAIVVFPQCPENDFWSSIKFTRNEGGNRFQFDYSQPMRLPLQRCLDLTRSLMATEKVNPKKVFITGLSMGGMGTFELVYHAPAIFKAAAPICGGGDSAAYNRQTAKVPFWIFHGDADPVVPVQLSRSMAARLKELKSKVRYTEYPGVQHNSWDNAFAEPGFLSWFWQQ